MKKKEQIPKETQQRLDELYSQLTSAIHDLQGIIRRMLDSEVEEGKRKIMTLEEEIANLTSPSSAEGLIARRGAIRAAIAVGDKEHAKELLNRFLAQDGIKADFVREFSQLL